MPKYHMRRSEKEVKEKDAMLSVLKEGKYAVIAFCSDNEPYIVTINYGFDEKRNALYFHCAHEGLKIDFITANPAVCATVIEDRGYVAGECRHAYRTLVLRGKMHIIEELVEKKHAVAVLLEHLEDNPDKIKPTLDKDGVYDEVGILRLDISEMTCKEGK